MSQQGKMQASIRAVTGTTGSFEGDWHALFTLHAVTGDIPNGPFEGRLLAWINAKLAAAHTNIAAAQQALAVANSAYNWSSLGTFNAAAP